MNDSHFLEQRITRLERQNRILLYGLGTVALLAVIGWQAPRKPEALKVTRLEVVDHRGVPLVVIAPARKDEGGSIVLRDSDGERRSWWETSPQSTAIGMVAGEIESPSSTLGLSASANQTTISLLGQGGTAVTLETNPSTPRLEMLDKSGRSVFKAPWK